jgi:putative ABC transport system ATP-binding protein
MSTLLSVKHLNKRFETTEVLHDLDLDIEENEFVAIMGRSGSGKSTLLYTMSGMDRPTSGQVIFSEKDLSALSDEEISRVRLREMGFIF